MQKYWCYQNLGYENLDSEGWYCKDEELNEYDKNVAEYCIKIIKIFISALTSEPSDNSYKFKNHLNWATYKALAFLEHPDIFDTLKDFAKLFHDNSEYDKAQFLYHSMFKITAVTLPKAKRREKLRDIYPRAYAKWTPEEDDVLRSQFQKEQLTIEEIATRLQRRVGGIRSRLIKQVLIEK